MESEKDSISIDAEQAVFPTIPPKTEDKDDETTYPEGGFAAYSVVLGAFFGIFGAFGLMNCIGVFQAYLSSHQLSGHSDSSISWIFSTYVFLGLFCSVQIGPLFDAKGPRPLVLAGSVAMVAALLLLGICRAYYQFFLVFAVLAGIGTSLGFTPCVGAIGHYFYVRRGTMNGIATAGGSIGGVIIPVMMPALFSRVGFAWATRILAFLYIFVGGVASLLIRSRLPPRPRTTVLPTPGILLQLDVALVVVGMFCMEMALFIPVNYLTVFALSTNSMSSTLAYQLNAILNAGSCIGRLVPGYLSDKMGRFNIAILAFLICGVSSLAIWLPLSLLDSGSPAMKPLIILFALLFGLASGSNISLSAPCIGQLCKTEELGRYLGTCYMIVSFGCLAGLPIAGALLKACNGSFWGMATFTGILYATAIVAFAAVRIRRVGWGIRAFF